MPQDPQAVITARIEATRDQFLEVNKQASVNKDLRRIHIVSRHLAELTAVADTLRRALRKLGELEVEADVGHRRAGQRFFPRNFSVTVTQGMLDNKRLTLTKQVRDHPNLMGEKMTISIPAINQVVETVLLAQGKKLRCRGVIDKFYEKAGVVAGTQVHLTETSPGHWLLNT